MGLRITEHKDCGHEMEDMYYKQQGNTNEHITEKIMEKEKMGKE